MTDNPPSGAAAPVARAAVLAAAAGLLSGAGVRAPPTPLAELLGHCALETDQFAFSDPLSERGLPVPLGKAQADLRPQVRGMVDVPGRVIYTHRNLHPAQRRFVALHELGHFVLPWHHGLLLTCSEADLSPAARRTWEREANLFAGACLFQGSGFATAARQGAFGWALVRRLARRYEASLEAAARQCVISRPEASLFLVAGLRPVVADARMAESGEPLLQVRYAVASPAWRRQYGADTLPAPGTPLAWRHPATRVLLAAGGDVLVAPLAGPLDTAPQWPLRAELLSNGYDVLLLAQSAPGGERYSSPAKGAG